MISLSPRLLAAARLLDGGKTVVDVGTDHAYLPVFLVESGKCGAAIALDIGAGPLENARQTVEKHGLQSAVLLRLSNGLQEIGPAEAGEICICGMGGTLIAEILSAAPWVCRPGMHLVLQPMTHGEDVRAYLCANGFTVRKEVCVTESDRHTYCCISAEWTGRVVTPSPGFLFFGTLSGQGGDAAAFAEKQFARIKKRADALRSAGTAPEEEAMLREAMNEYRARKKEAAE